MKEERREKRREGKCKRGKHGRRNGGEEIRKEGEVERKHVVVQKERRRGNMVEEKRGGSVGSLSALPPQRERLSGGGDGCPSCLPIVNTRQQAAG